uniref:NADH dehydrogenase subunit 4L n=1 Tax=Carpoglyphus lactis TaxID=223459 RepID=A0A7D5A8B8_CARLC|nr:NADH dehydrogenase subunit 4L [Carpoglyphus lactis]QKV10191.1 NADH dehydrogenase subunit 4L [Carpoglyphus lactis]
MLISLMFLIFMLFSLYFYNMHSVISLLTIEFFILFGFFVVCMTFSWYVSILFLLIAVCVGSYGVSLYVSSIFSFSGSKKFSNLV